MMIRVVHIILAFGLAAIYPAIAAAQSPDPLPSRNDGEIKHAITQFVASVTKEGSPDFVPQEKRIATFDNDGTLWAEHPAVQFEFVAPFWCNQRRIRRNVLEFFHSAQHPKFKQTYNKTAYQPMLELLAYLRNHGFKTYLSSGGGVGFMRVIAYDTYGIVPEHVIGSYAVNSFEQVDGEWKIVKSSKNLFVHIV